MLHWVAEQYVKNEILLKKEVTKKSKKNNRKK
jgi:hypothetical protein